jgi:hypothetical protein
MTVEVSAMTSHEHERSFVCPACSAEQWVPERAELGFGCKVCGAHLVRRDHHIHFEWDHREGSLHRTPDALVPAHTLQTH